MSEFPPLDDLIPHTGTMRLIDGVVAADGEAVTAEAKIRRGNLFFQEGKGVPAYVGFELMAQTVSAYDGLRRWRRGEAPAIGFLLGCRRYATVRDYFEDGEVLRIEVQSLLGEDGLASFRCKINDAAGAEVASGVLNVYRPADPIAFLSEQR
jgi:predicted hotdog family 3-hydroxylacyl-ACP dehydratase